ncbi:MAG TPA: MG2 domain-containing protein, partial [Dysgonamonadaceae bacterium]|nr:MG2 domain-containing protein [Dysgonamonadaceae bacterium]
MKQTVFILIALLITMTHQAQNKQSMNDNNYTNLWQKVDDAEKKSLPKSASDVVNIIMKQAVDDKNGPQIIKALIHQGKYDLAIDTENDTMMFHNLTQMLQSTDDVTEKAVLHSMLAELYIQYYQNDSWNIRERTQLADFVPEDMKEWTKNNFFDKVVTHTKASLTEQADLENTKVDKYAAVVNLGKDSRQFYPSMFDFLALRALDVLKKVDEDQDLSRSLNKAGIDKKDLFAPANEFVQLSIEPDSSNYNLQVFVVYQKLISSLQRRNLEQSVVLMELDKLNFLRRLNSAYKLYAFDAIHNLYEQWKDKDFSVEIVNEMIGFYETHEVGRFMNEENQVKNYPETIELYNLLQRTITAFPNYERINLLKNKLNNITQPTFTINSEKSFTSSGEKKFNLKYRNLIELRVKLYRVETPLMNENIYRQEQMRKVKKTFIKEMIVPLLANEPYVFDADSFQLNIDDPGAYKLEFDADKQIDPSSFSEYYFTVSNIASFARSSSQQNYEFFVVDRNTGKPVTDAQINIYTVPRNSRDDFPTLLKTIPVDALGMARYNTSMSNGTVFYHAVLKGDNGLPLTQLPYRYYERSEPEKDKTTETTSIFTDRSLYRPGQIVHFKAIAATTIDKDHSATINKAIEFTLRDANNQEVAKQSLTTNEFGSVSGEFVLPQGMLTGGFSIQANNGSTYFKVEEYKRPTFEVTFDKIEKTYKFGEEVTLKGKAESFSGIQLQNAEVSYTITRRQAWWWRWGGGGAEHYTDGVITTNDEGEFEINFTPHLTDEDGREETIYSFTVEASVTDVNGETQVTTHTVTVGTVSMILSMNMPEKMEKGFSDEIKIEAKNLDGNDIKAKGTYQIFSLEDNDSIRQQVSEGTFETGIQAELKSKLKTSPSGKYRIKLSAQDDGGNTVTEEKDVLLFSYSDKQPPITTNEWLVIKNPTFSKTKPAEVILGVTDKNVNVLYELWQGNKLLERKWIQLNSENRLFSFPHKTEYAEGVTLSLTYVKDDKFYTHNIGLMLEEEITDLNIKLDVFRDKMLPGGKEEWRISVTDVKQQPALAEVLASMYDYSLNSIYPTNEWRLQLPSNRRYIASPRLLQDASFSTNSISGYQSLPYLDFKEFQFDAFNWFDFSFGRYKQFMVRGLQSRVASDEVVVVEFGQQKKASIVGSASVELSSNETMPPAPEEAGSLEEQAPQIRKNFDETAFFFPQ